MPLLPSVCYENLAGALTRTERGQKRQRLHAAGLDRRIELPYLRTSVQVPPSLSGAALSDIPGHYPPRPEGTERPK